MRFRRVVILLVCTLLLPGSAFAVGVIGKIRVKVDGFQGWHQMRDRDLEIQVEGVPGNTLKEGVFRIDDLGIFGRNLFEGTAATFFDDDNNYVRFLVGRHRIVLPVDWRGRVVDNYLVLEPMLCEVLANGTGGCSRDPMALDGYIQDIRRQLGLPVVSQQPLEPTVVGPGPSKPFSERPADGTVIQEELSATPPVPAKPVSPVVPKQPEKSQPASPKPAPQSDPVLDLDIVEPME